jgi:hypothetical protein
MEKAAQNGIYAADFLTITRAMAGILYWFSEMAHPKPTS